MGHSFGEYISNNDATSEKDGTKTAKCSVCGAKDTIVDEGTMKMIAIVEITKKPNKLNYALNESLNLEGMILTATYTDGTKGVISDYEVSGYDAEKLGEQTLTVTVDGHSDVLTIQVSETVEEPQDPVDTPADTEVPPWAAVPVLGGILLFVLTLGRKILFRNK